MKQPKLHYSPCFKILIIPTLILFSSKERSLNFFFLSCVNLIIVLENLDHVTLHIFLFVNKCVVLAFKYLLVNEICLT